jgi:hypothetical protein
MFGSKTEGHLVLSTSVIMLLIVAVIGSSSNNFIPQNVYAGKYSTINEQAASPVNNCSGDNCIINNPQTQTQGKDNVVNTEITTRSGSSGPPGATPGPGPGPGPNQQQLQVRQVNGDPTLVLPNSSGAAVANCDPNENVTGGGLIFGEIGSVLSNEINPQYSERASENGWEVTYFNPGPRDINILAFAECASLVP